MVAAAPTVDDDIVICDHSLYNSHHFSMGPHMHQVVTLMSWLVECKFIYFGRGLI
jgi:hypothetical protein